MAEKNNSEVIDSNIISILDQMANTVPEDYEQDDLSTFTSNADSGQDTNLEPTSSGIHLVSPQDDKYLERRRKNNLAAKKSRDARKIRENQLKCKVACLENANQVLRTELDRERKLNEELNAVVEKVQLENVAMKKKCKCQDKAEDCIK